MEAWTKNPDGIYSATLNLSSAQIALCRGLNVTFPDKPAGVSDEQWIQHHEYMAATYPNGIPDGVRVGTIFNVTADDPPKVEGKP